MYMNSVKSSFYWYITYVDIHLFSKTYMSYDDIFGEKYFRDHSLYIQIYVDSTYFILSSHWYLCFSI